MYSRGFKVSQIDLITNFDKDKKKIIINKIHIIFLRYIEKMYKIFWRRQNNKLKQEGIAENALFKIIRNTGYKKKV